MILYKFCTIGNTGLNFLQIKVNRKCKFFAVSGVVTNLTIPEFELREEENEKVVIPCVQHKTASQGLVQLAVTEDIKEILIYYYEKVCMKIVPAEEICKHKLFFGI